MNELSRHITALLLEHNCVIVPRLGGFVAGSIPATFVADEGLMLPPRRSVGFVSRLTTNDGLLTESYMRAYGINYPEAMKMVANAVGELKNELREHGEVELGSIGRLYLRLDGHYDFVPNEVGILSPSLYGLSSFSVKRIDRGSVRLPMEVATVEEPKASAKKNYTLRLNRELVNYVAAVVVAFVFYMAWAPATLDGTAPSADRVAAMPFAAPAVASAKPVLSPLVVERQLADSVSAEQVSVDRVEQPDNGHFTLVLMSRIPKKNAQKCVAELHDKGLAEADVLTKGRMVRVIFGRYADEGAAYRALNELRQTHPETFNESWVLELK